MTSIRMFKGLIVALTVAISACSVTKIPDNLAYGVLNNNDLETVRAGLPTYLLLMDGLLETYPDSASLLSSASSLNSAYAGVFVEDEVRARLMTNKALHLAQRAACAHNRAACGLKTMEFERFEKVVLDMDSQKDVPILYTLGTSWASYIQMNSADWGAIADLAKVQLVMNHLYELDPNYENGMVPLYLGVLSSLLPPALGGKPDVAQAYFEEGIEISEGKNLIIKVMYAQQFARLIFDQELHDRLLSEVVASDPNLKGFTLQNIYAQDEAEKLLAESVEYF